MALNFGENHRTSPREYDESYVKNIRDMVLRKGLEISAFGSYVDPLMPLHQKHFEEAFKIAYDLGHQPRENLVWRWSLKIHRPG